MAKTIWMDRLVDVQRTPGGEVVSFILDCEGETICIRCLRADGLEAIKFSERRWCELDRAERKAAVLPIRKRQ